MIFSATSVTRLGEIIAWHVEHKKFMKREQYWRSWANSNECKMIKNATSSSKEHPPIEHLEATNPNSDATFVSTNRHSPYNSKLKRFDLKIVKTKILLQSKEGWIEEDKQSQRVSKRSNGNTFRKSTDWRWRGTCMRISQSSSKNWNTVQLGSEAATWRKFRMNELRKSILEQRTTAMVERPVRISSIASCGAGGNSE